MRILIFTVMLLLCAGMGKAQDRLFLHYIKLEYNATKNRSFVNESYSFTKGKDTVKLNVKVPFDFEKNEVINRGIYYNCHLKEDSSYYISIRKICIKDMFDVPNNYYKQNTVVDKTDCSKFVEVEKNTPYSYEGNYGRYVDIDGSLYEIVGFKPGDGCVFQH